MHFPKREQLQEFEQLMLAQASASRYGAALAAFSLGFRLAQSVDAAPAPEPPVWRHALNECNDAHVELDKMGAPRTKTARRIRGEGDETLTIGLVERLRALPRTGGVSVTVVPPGAPDISALIVRLRAAADAYDNYAKHDFERALLREAADCLEAIILR